MAQACGKCGGSIFLGEVKCPNCGAPTGQAPTPRPSPEGGGRGSSDTAARRGSPPPEGLELLIDKHQADKEAFRDPEPVKFYDRDGAFMIGTGIDLSDSLEVKRDSRGNVIWDWKHALIGGIVIAIVIAAAVAWLFGVFDGFLDTSSTRGR